MTDKFYEASEVEEKYMEVIITADDDEYIYWVNIETLSEDEDEYDWAIEKALAYHSQLGLPSATEEDAEVGEPFSRESSEFTFVD